MSSFCIIPTNGVTYRMINGSTSPNKSLARKSIDGSMTLLEITEPAADVFLDYQIYDMEQIKVLLNTHEWDESVTNPQEGWWAWLINFFK